MDLKRNLLGLQRHISNQLTLLIVVSLYAFISCKRPAQAPPIQSVISEEVNDLIPKDFYDFYEKFHSDSSFQMNHISFPLEGIPDQADPKFIGDEKFYFTNDNWTIQKNIRKDAGDFNVSWKALNPIIIEETAKHKHNDLKIIRRFAKVSDSWRLIYYAGMNMYKSPGTDSLNSNF